MKSSTSLRNYMYAIMILFITLSGFGQMPIFKRYYIADIPGLGWLARFYALHSIHYITAMLLICFIFYIVLDFFLSGEDLKRLTGSGLFKALIITGLTITGVLMVFRNLAGVYFNHNFIIMLNLTHLVLCMMLLIVSLYTLIYRKKWID